MCEDLRIVVLAYFKARDEYDHAAHVYKHWANNQEAQVNSENSFKKFQDMEKRLKSVVGLTK